MTKEPNPGVSRDARISNEGLSRLEKHLQLGTKMSEPIRQQWLKRYGDEARVLLKKHGYELND
ncbi:MAG: hypothetical protein IMF17_01880 [Proteobacteria bacterium]|nr:hypothetical protein [Pseudomonadota bacterium]